MRRIFFAKEASALLYANVRKNTIGALRVRHISKFRLLAKQIMPTGLKYAVIKSMFHYLPDHLLLSSINWTSLINVINVFWFGHNMVRK